MDNTFGLQWMMTWDPEERRKLLRQEAKRRKTAAAQNQLRAIKAHSSKRVCSDDKYGDVALPPGVLHKVMACLAVVEPDGVRGPAMAARDLASAALVSWDFYTAAKHGVTILEQQAAALTLTYETHFTRPASVKCSPQTLKQLQLLGPNSGWSWAQWSALLQDPLQYKVPQLKQAARQLSIPVTASKAVLVVNILQAFGLQGPSRVHPQLLRAVLLERCCTSPWVGCEELVHVWGVLNRLSSHEIDQNWPGLSEVVCKRWVMAAAAWRAALHKYAGVCSKQQLVQLEVEVQQLLAERVHRL